ncbi:hypothetical protein NDU88_005350 [Pleurodeles waltl]|uniref:Reverse transcriptase zinc-binding domain-containing protein n=1 Tax=Pleurodeles waltl TaxID=8319 RepID=A0AAV7RM28_PLEWA|nr:hypothetical protein NDU88_005350 [Pleurodeles waltl]
MPRCRGRGSEAVARAPRTRMSSGPQDAEDAEAMLFPGRRGRENQAVSRMPRTRILLHSGAQLNDDLVRRWELAGFSKIGDFRAMDNWETPLNILTTVKNDFLLVGSYNILLHILRDLDVNSIVNVQSLVTELVDPPGIRTAGSWRRLLADRDKADLGTKARRKWAHQEGLEVSSDCWETINRLNFTVLRGANWHQIIFFCKWLLYRTPQALSRAGTVYPDMCFRCKEVGVAGCIHVIAKCRCIQGYWEGIFAMLTTMAPVSISPSIRLMSLRYDPKARLSSRWEKLVFIAAAVARSLLLRNWHSELSPTSQEWRCKMT